MTDFSGQVAVITGASGLLASGVVPIFKAGGARLALVGAPERIYARFPDLKDDAAHLCLPADLSQPDAVAKLEQDLVAAFGRIDILVNIVGGWDAGAPVQDISLDTWQTMLRLNATATFLICRAVIPVMLKNGGGAIINIGARAALRSSGNDAAYAASKAALLRLTESISEEYKRRGIRVNAVLPSTIVSSEQYAADPHSGVSPAQLGQVIAFLASEAGAIIHGAAIPAYGTRF